jgi:hypothetical protein
VFVSNNKMKTVLNLRATSREATMNEADEEKVSVAIEEAITGTGPPLGKTISGVPNC